MSGTPVTAPTEVSLIPHPSLIVIPARRGSTRLPDKLLRRETGRPVLQHTIERALEAARRTVALVWVVCDDPELARVATACGVRSVMTGPCNSGTERIAVALNSLPACSAVLNLQADEPEMPTEWIVECLAACAQSGGPDVATVAVPLEAPDPVVSDPNVVKVVLTHDGHAMYFSRAPIPCIRDGGGKVPAPRALRHVGIYAYSRAFLQRYHDLPVSELELAECLEQLRFLQAGARIRVLVKTEPELNVRGIDTENDYREFVARHQAAAR